MRDPQWMAGDPATFAVQSEGIQEVECDCGWSGEVGTNEDYSHGIVSWIAEWKCPSCDESHTTEGEYDPREDAEIDF